MKRLIWVTLVTVGFGALSLAQEKKESKKDVPTAISNAFVSGFPGSSKVKWEKEKGGYEVNFLQHEKEISAVYDKEAKLIETEIVIKPTELPAAVQDYVKKNYKNALIKEAAKITRSGGEITYEAEVSKKDLIFDATGRFIKIEAE